MSEPRLMTKAELMAAIQRNWEALEAALLRMTEAQLTTPQDAGGWTVKDHLIHLAGWEGAVVSFLQRRPMYAGLGVDAALYRSGDIDAINEAVVQQSKNLPLGEALALFRDVHRQLMELLQPLTDADLLQPYGHYLPDEPGAGDDLPAVTVIGNNTADHYAEHQAWIEALVANEV
jgi:hypothetical protein